VKWPELALAVVVELPLAALLVELLELDLLLLPHPAAMTATTSNSAAAERARKGFRRV
jgi:hypothetical protein